MSKEIKYIYYCDCSECDGLGRILNDNKNVVCRCCEVCSHGFAFAE